MTIYCEDCTNPNGMRRKVGAVPFFVLVTGMVDRYPGVDDSGEHGIEGYHQCPSCRRFVRWEVIPPTAKKKLDAIAA